MSRRYKEFEEDGILFIEGSANDILRVIKRIERQDKVSLFCKKPVMRTQRVYLMEIKGRFYHVYREGGKR